MLKWKFIVSAYNMKLHMDTFREEKNLVPRYILGFGNYLFFTFAAWSHASFIRNLELTIS